MSECKFEYGTTTAYGQSATCSPAPGSGTSPVAVSASVTGLNERTAYHFRVSATNVAGTSTGADQILRTGPFPHWYKNSLKTGGLEASEKLQTVSWGTLTLTPEAPSSAPPTTCETANGGFVENPEGVTGAAGRGQTQNYGAWNCANASCPSGLVEFPASSGKFVEREALILPGGEGVVGSIVRSLPWSTELFGPSAGKVRVESKGVVLVLACIAQNTGGAPLLLTRATVCSTTPVNLQTPLFENGIQIGGPLTSKLTFDSESGKLHCKGPGTKEGEEIEFTASTTGKVHTMTYEGQELVFAK